MRQKKRWSDLSRSQRAFVVLAGMVETILTAVALRDLAHRPSDQVRGPKLLWRIGCLVQPFGPISYLLFGRRSYSDGSAPT